MAYQPKDTKERIQHRLKIVHGHLNKVQQMIDTDVYCIDIIHQSQAIQKALKEVDNLMLEGHLNSCVVDAIKQGRSEEAVEEILQVFKKAGV